MAYYCANSLLLRQLFFITCCTANCHELFSVVE
jgi:hypothetical protein